MGYAIPDARLHVLYESQYSREPVRVSRVRILRTFHPSTYQPRRPTRIKRPFHFRWSVGLIAMLPSTQCALRMQNPHGVFSHQHSRTLVKPDHDPLPSRSQIRQRESKSHVGMHSRLFLQPNLHRPSRTMTT